MQVIVIYDNFSSCSRIAFLKTPKTEARIPKANSTIRQAGDSQ